MKSQREVADSIVGLSIAIDIQALSTRAVYLKRGGENVAKHQADIVRLTERIMEVLGAYIDED